MLFISLSKVQRKIVENIRDRRLQMELTQEDLSGRLYFGSGIQPVGRLEIRDSIIYSE